MPDTSEPPRPRSLIDRLTAAFREVTSREEVVEELRQAQRHNVIDAETLSMMEGALQVSQLRAADLMLPRAQVDAIDISEPKEKWIKTVIESGHSRFPAYQDELDNVIGILHAKDLLLLVADEKLDVKSCLRPARFIPESQPINILLRDFKASRNHLALVIDEFGGISGLITIEDVLEQIVGEISDEFDHDDKLNYIVPVTSNSWRVNAVTNIEQFNEVFNSTLSDDYCETIGGLVTDRFEHVPRVGEEIEEAGFTFKIIKADERQTLQLLVTKKEA